MCPLCWHSSFRLWKWTTGQSEAPDRLPASPPHLTASFCKHFVCFRICTSADIKAGSQEENQTNRRGLTVQIKINTNKHLEAARCSSELYKAVFVNGITAWLKTRSSSTKTWHTWCNKLLQSRENNIATSCICSVYAKHVSILRSAGRNIATTAQLDIGRLSFLVRGPITYFVHAVENYVSFLIRTL